MDDIIEIRATVRREMLDRVVCVLKEAGVPRFAVTRIGGCAPGSSGQSLMA